MTRDVRLLTFTSLYPSAVRPRHGIFVEARLQRLVRRGGVTATVVAPVPWFPFAGERWGEYGRMAATPRRDSRGGIEVSYPRYPMLPRLGMRMQPRAMAAASMRDVESLVRAGSDIDLVDAHYLYPDGVAAAAIARRLGRPLVLTARGSDVNVIAQLLGPREKILRAIEAAAAVIAVSGALKSALMGLGVPASKITVLRNGVDAELFQPQNRAAARAGLGLPDGVPVVASVGNLVEGKRHDLVLEAAAAIDSAHALIVGRGPARARLVQTARDLGIERRVVFHDEMPQARLRSVYSAANVLVLASEREGWPNVLLEAAACGTPVVAFNIGGVPEILGNPALGTIARGDHVAAPLVRAIRTLLSEDRSPAAVRAAALPFAWEPVLDAQRSLYRQVAVASDEAAASTVGETIRA